MFFLSSGILGAEESTSALTPPYPCSPNYLLLQYGLYDCLYITRKTTADLLEPCPQEWDLDTLFHAEFGHGTDAGNVDWSPETVSHLLIKRREENSFHWITLDVKPIQTLEDLRTGLQGYDPTNASQVSYQYALIPYYWGIEGFSRYSTVYSVFEKLFITEKETIYGTLATDGFCNTSRITPSSLLETMHNPYPVYIRSTIANYDKGSCTGKFLELDENCELVMEDAQRIPYQRRVMDFLTNGRPKLLKHFDGRIWLIHVTGSPTDNAEEVYNHRAISFEWAETGRFDSEKDLYYAGLTDIGEEWWNI